MATDLPGADKVLTCIACKAEGRPSEFIWGAGEQAYYAQRNLAVPRRCKACRARRKLVDGTFGKRVVVVDTVTNLVLCGRCRNPASKSVSLAKGEALCLTCSGQEKTVTPSEDFLSYDEWHEEKGRNPYASR